MPKIKFAIQQTKNSMHAYGVMEEWIAVELLSKYDISVIKRKFINLDSNFPIHYRKAIISKSAAYLGSSCGENSWPIIHALPEYAFTFESIIPGSKLFPQICFAINNVIYFYCEPILNPGAKIEVVYFTDHSSNYPTPNWPQRIIQKLYKL